MRLSMSEINSIKEALSEIDSEAKVYLFGSRVDDHKKGGDIDLLVFSEKIDLQKQIKLEAKLWSNLDEQKIDVVVADQYNKNFVDLIINEAVLL